MTEITPLLDSLFRNRDYTTREGTIKAICDECDRQGLTLDTQKAYVLATTQHETNNTFKPVTEAYFLKNPLKYLRKLRYAPYWGRGFVQLTWDFNYRKYSELLGIDLIKDPDRASEPAIACFIMVHGFRTGGFTGKRLTDYIRKDKYDPVGARRCINGVDKAKKIADMCGSWVRYLRGSSKI
jgi:predicted chitinase